MTQSVSSRGGTDHLEKSVKSSIFNDLSSILRGSGRVVKGSANDSKAVGFAQKPESIQWGPPPEDAVLLQQNGYNFLDSEDSLPL